MKKVYIIGASSKIAESLNALLKQEYAPVFFGRTNPFQLDAFISHEGITGEESVAKLSSMILDDLKANKGISEVYLVVLAGVSSHSWTESFFVNEYLPARLSEDFAECVMGLGLHGAVTLVGSTAAYQGAKLPYATTKASLAGILHTISRDYQGTVRINLILPSAFDSGMIADWGDAKRSAVAQSNHIGRLGTADDMADAIRFTIANSFITNSIINMSGGTVHI